MYQSESLNSERSLISLDGQQLPPFSHGKICFEDGHQRLRSVCRTFSIVRLNSKIICDFKCIHK